MNSWDEIHESPELVTSSLLYNDNKLNYKILVLIDI